jgi:DNA end-binding protein Ku
MARRSRAKTPKGARKQHTPSRAIWKGSIDFGLVNIAVRLYSAESSGRLNFDLLDKRDFSRVRYRRVNEKTGREVPWDEIIKAHEYENDEYVALSDDDFAQANVQATQTIAITDFVEAAEVSPVYYDKPYYLEPLKNARRAYALLREVLDKTNKVGIAKVVIRTRQHLAMLFADGPKLVLNLLRFSHELRDTSGLDLPKVGPKSASVSPQEVEMAERLVETMESKWNPEKYHDEYRADLMKIINKKIKSGKTKVIETSKPAAPRQERGKVIDIMHLLKQSVKQADRKKDAPARQRKAG